MRRASGWRAPRRCGACTPRPGEPEDYIVPSPLMPHLMFEWVLRRARQRWPERPVEIAPVPGELGTPYDRAAPDHTRYVSFAAWLCPTHCVEPAICPAIGAPRTWATGEAIGRLTPRQRAGGRAAALAARQRARGGGGGWGGARQAQRTAASGRGIRNRAFPRAPRAGPGGGGRSPAIGIPERCLRP